MRDFKNLLPQADFKKIYENIQIEKTELFSDYKLNEDMDFSNKLGWSQSVVGSAINKIFSFVTKYVEYIKLGILKKQIDNEFRKAVLVAIDAMNLTIKEKDPLSFDDAFDGMVEYTSEITVETHASTTNYINSIMKLEEQQQEAYKEIHELEIEILRYKYKKTLEKDKAAQAQAAQTAQTEQNDKIVLFKKGKTVEENLENQIATVNSLIGKLNAEDLKTNNNSGMLAAISKKLEEEIAITNDGTAKNALVKFKEDIDSKIKELPQSTIDDTDYNQRKDSYISKITIEKDLKKEFTNFNKKLIELFKNQTDDSKKKTLRKIIREFGGEDQIRTMSDEELKKKVDNAKISLKNAGFALNDIINDNYSFNDFFDLCEKIYYMNFEKLFEDNLPVKKGNTLPAQTNKGNTLPAQTNKGNTLPAQTNKEQTQGQTQGQGQTQDEEVTAMNLKIKTLKEKIVKFKQSISAEQKESLTATLDTKTTVKESIKLNLNDGEDVTKAYEKYKNSDDFDCEEIMKLLTNDEDKKKFIKIVIDHVNNETLKVIALKAVALYDPEYGQAKEGIYSRVNFRTTDADRTKIENKWLQMISQVKAKYMYCFSMNGSFPQSLDPIGLMNSDKSLRKSFQEYGTQAKDAVKETKPKDGNDDLNKPTLNTYQLANLGLSIGKIKEFGILTLQSSKWTLGLLIKKIIYNKKIAYMLLDYYKWEEILKNVSLEENKTDDVNDILKNNKYLNPIEDKNISDDVLLNILKILGDLKRRSIFLVKNDIKIGVKNPFIVSRLSLTDTDIYINYVDSDDKFKTNKLSDITDKITLGKINIDNIYSIKDDDAKNNQWKDLLSINGKDSEKKYQNLLINNENDLKNIINK